MNLLVLFALFFLVLAAAIFSFRMGLRWFYVYSAAVAAGMFVTTFLQINIFGQILFISEVFLAVGFLMTDVVEEHYGKQAARVVIPIIVSTLLFLWGICFVASLFVPAETDTFYVIVSTIMSVYTPLAIGLFAIFFIIEQYLDTWLFDYIRRKTKGRWLWLRNNLATVATQTLDVFLSYGIVGSILFPQLTWAQLGSAMLAAAVFKYTMAILDTPFVYLSYYFKPKELTEKVG